MPNRTPEAKELIDSLAVIPADEYCNGRTPTGYCRHVAGFRTDHVGNGRCYLHGGRAGRPIVHGRYSKELRKELQAKYEEVVNDPALLEMYGELALLKTVLLGLLEQVHDQLGQTDSDFFVQKVSNQFGDKLEQSPYIKTLLDVAESMSRIYQKITDAEIKSASALTPKAVMDIVQQIKLVMDKRCGECPVRIHVGQELATIRVKQ